MILGDPGDPGDPGGSTSFSKENLRNKKKPLNKSVAPFYCWLLCSVSGFSQPLSSY